MGGGSLSYIAVVLHITDHSGTLHFRLLAEHWLVQCTTPACVSALLEFNIANGDIKVSAEMHVLHIFRPYLFIFSREKKSCLNITLTVLMLSSALLSEFTPGVQSHCVGETEITLFLCGKNSVSWFSTVDIAQIKQYRTFDNIAITQAIYVISLIAKTICSHESH